MTERGEVWIADLDPVLYNEQGGVRPVVILSKSRYNGWRPRLAVVVPVTTRERGLRHHIPVTGGGLDRRSFAMPEYVRSISQRRLIKRLGVADPHTVDQVHEWVEWMVSSGFVELGGDVGAT